MMNSRGGPPFEGLYVDEFLRRSPFCGLMLMNSRGGPPILKGVPPLGTISLDLAVYEFSDVCAERAVFGRTEKTEMA